VKELLSREGHAFVAKDVDEDHDAYSELIARGLRTVPVTVIGERAIKGFDEPALREALAARSSPDR
jgi:glutaredoxin